VTWLWTKLQGFKTIGFNVLCMLAALSYWATTYNWSLVSADKAAYIVVGVNIANIVLRFLTSTPPMTGKD
jgi:hypothetical protein